MPKREEPLDVFGRFLMTKVRDPGINHLDGLLAGHWKAPSLQKLQRDLATLTPEQQDTVRRAFVASLDTAIHDFLFALQEETDNGGRVTVQVEGKNIAEQSDGLHGELFTEDGWYARFSAHGEPPDEV